MKKVIFLLIVMGAAYAFLSWKMNDYVGPFFVITALLIINYFASRLLNNKNNDD